MAGSWNNPSKSRRSEMDNTRQPFTSTSNERTILESLKEIIKEHDKHGVYDYLPKKRNKDSHNTHPRHEGKTRESKCKCSIDGEMKAESITIGDNNVQLVYKDKDSRNNEPNITTIGSNNIVLHVTPYQLRDETGNVLNGLTEVDVLVRRLKECMSPNSYSGSNNFDKFNESTPKQHTKQNIPASNEYWTPENSSSSNCTTSDIPTKGPYSYAKTDDVKRWTRQEPTENSCHGSTCSSNISNTMEDFNDEPVYSTAKAIDEDTISLKLKAKRHQTSLDDVLNEEDVKKFMKKADGSKYAVEIFPYMDDFGYIDRANFAPPTYSAPEPPKKGKTLEDCEWYHGGIDAHEANGRLRRSKNHGSFLVRLPSKSSISHKYTLSFLDEAKLKHLKLNETNGKYHFEDSKEDKDKFKTVVDMMDTLQRTKMEIQDEITGGWKFVKLVPVQKH